MITTPHNDHECLAAIHDRVRAAVAESDETTKQWARHLGSRAAIARWLRGLPQRDDTGGREDGPRVGQCAPPQRLRLLPFPPDPNCVERAAIYLFLAELVDPATVRALATIDTPAGRHTLPVEAGRPVVLDPRVPRNAAQAGLDLATGKPMPTTLPASVAWVCRTAAEPLGLVPGGARALRNGIRALGGVAAGVPIDAACDECVSTVLAMADREAARWGDAARAVVRRVERAAADLALDAGLTPPRNLRIAGYRIDPSAAVRAVARIGSRVGSTALAANLAALGVTPAVVGVIECELRREGLTLGPLAQLGPASPTCT